MNKVIILGNLTKDPELNTTNNGISVCRFTLAVSRRFSNSEGEREADFIPVIVWRGQAENCAKYLKKGSKACVTGSLQVRSYEAQDGSKRYSTEVVAEEVEFVSSKNNSSDDGDEQPQRAKSEKGSKAEKADKVSKFEPVDDDDLPF